jgi:menaquinone-dependent protoporphyrinogen oxidase
MIAQPAAKALTARNCRRDSCRDNGCMARIAIIFGSVDGHTARVAERIAATLVRAGHAVDVAPAGPPGIAASLAQYDAVIVGSAIRYGHHRPQVEALVRANLGTIVERPNAFFSVSLSAGGPGARPAEASGYVEEFIERTGWQPRSVALFAGALRYTHYNPFIRFMMRLIVGIAGGETDTTRDYEYTDWQAVERFAGEFCAQLEAVPVA